LLVAVQFIPVHRTNPGGGAEIVASADVAAVFERSCCDCHSNETKWPWYSYPAPVSWIVAHDVDEGPDGKGGGAGGNLPLNRSPVRGSAEGGILWTDRTLQLTGPKTAA
jgi:hypothetical protein